MVQLNPLSFARLGCGLDPELRQATLAVALAFNDPAGSRDARHEAGNRLLSLQGAVDTSDDKRLSKMLAAMTLLVVELHREAEAAARASKPGDAPVPHSPARPSVYGVSRIAEAPKAILAHFDQPLSDDQMREMHDLLRTAFGPRRPREGGA